MSESRIKADISILHRDKDRHLGMPFVSAIGPDRYMLVYRDAPVRKPMTPFDPQAVIGTMTGIRPWAPDRDTFRQVPRYRSCGTAPAVVKLSDTRALITDNSWYIFNWLGEYEVKMVADYDWAIVMRGGQAIIVDTSGDRLLFGKPRPITSVHYPAVSCYDVPIVIGENTALCPVDYDINCTQLMDKPWETVIMRSDDGGRTWRLHGEIHMEKDHPDMPKLHLPSVKKLPDGKMICMLVEYDPAQKLRLCESEDGGISWSTPRETGLAGIHHSLIPMSDGRLAAIFTGTNQPFGIRLRLSEDGGHTWPESAAWIIDDSGKSFDCGWPRGFQIDDGGIFVSYYMHTADDSRTLFSARFSI